MSKIHELFEKHNDEYLEFSRVENKLSNRADLHGMILLDKLFPWDHDIICSSGHDEVWLSVGGEDLGKLTESQVIELLRCGILHDESGDCLYVFT